MDLKTREEIETWLRERIAKEIKTTAEAVPVNVLFTNFGLDSIVIVTLVTDLEDWLKVSLDPTIFWEYPSIEALSEWLITEKLQDAEARAQVRAQIQKPFVRGSAKIVQND